MKQHYILVKKLSFWMRLTKRWNTLYTQVKETVNLKKLNKLNSISLLLGVKRKILFATLTGAITLGVNAQVEFQQARFGVNQTIPNLGGFSKVRPVFVDLDKDGDKDLIIANSDSYSHLKYFTNEDNHFVEQIGDNNPFSHITDGWWYAPAMGDVDDDGDLDLILGESNGEIEYYRNDDFVFNLQTGADNPFDDIDVNRYSTPVLGDLDNDGDVDLLVANAITKTISYYQNNNDAYVEQTGDDNPFDETVEYGSRPTPNFLDFDNDGDLDAVIGTYDGKIIYLENTINVDNLFVTKTGDDNPFNAVGTTSLGGIAPSFIDLDDDGDLDLVNGTKRAVLEFFENDNQVFVSKTSEVNLFEETLGVSYAAVPVFEDLDNDQVKELIVGSGNGTISYFKYENDEFVKQLDENNPFDGIDVGNHAYPRFTDIDGDNDLDLIVGTADGDITSFVNEDNVFTELTDGNNPFNTINIGDNTSLSFIDLDEDGNQDLVVSGYHEDFLYYKNTDNSFEEQPDSLNPFSDINTRYISLTFSDVDEDGDQDLLLGKYYGGGIFYFENNDNVFTQQTEGNNPFNEVAVNYSSAPTFADVDNDGDLDLFVGSGQGRIVEYKNISTDPTGVLSSANEVEILRIYPNPASSVINTEIGPLDILDALGSPVLSTESTGQVNVSSLEAGIYLVNQNGKRTKLVVE